jgi:hypothetical protein
MSKSKPRKADEIFELKKIIKDRDDEIRRLHRKLHNQEKQEKFEKKAQSKKKVPAVPKETEPDQCPDCAKGKLKITDLGARNLTTCTVCNYRKVTKNG